MHNSKNKKIGIYSLFFSIIIVCNFMSGQVFIPMSRMAHVMYKGYGGIESVNHKIKFVDTKNLGFDLNIPEVSKRFGCKTKMGQDFIAFYLNKPISSKDLHNTIAHRQYMIKELLQNPDLLSKLQSLIDSANEHESTVIDFMAKRFVMNHKEFTENPFKFIYNFMGQSTLWQTYSLWLSATTLINPIYEKGAIVTDAFSGYVQPFIAGEKTFSPLGEMKSWYNKTTDFSHFDTASFVTNSLMATFNLGSPGKTAVTNTREVWGIVLAIMSLYDHYTDAVEKRNALYSLSQLINIAQDIEELCRNYKIQHQFKVSAIQSHKGKEVLQALSHSRYQDKTSSMFLTTAVKTLIYDVYEYDNVFAPVYASIAEIDAYVAIAQKMMQLQHENHHLTFVEFLNGDQPTIHAREFWNMLVPDDKVVTNDIYEHRNIILTGSNEGGKTTAIRAILQNIVLAQTFGIAAATEFKLTQFDSIYSFLNISDDILQGKSRFASELKQAQDILQKIKNLYQGEKFFFAFDELFTGTNGEDGAQCAYEFINNVASFKGIQFIYATHFNILKTIGAKNSACANYKIEPPLRNALGQFIRDAKGQLIYPYKLSPGANDVNVAMDRARDAGIFA